MAVKEIWAMPPKLFKTKNGNSVLVGVKTYYNTGKIYKGTGARERARAEKRKKLRDKDQSEEETPPRPR